MEIPIFSPEEQEEIINTCLNNLVGCKKVKKIQKTKKENELKAHPCATMIKESLKRTSDNENYFFDRAFFIKTQTYGTTDNGNRLIISTNQAFWKNNSFLYVYRFQEAAKLWPKYTKKIKSVSIS